MFSLFFFTTLFEMRRPVFGLVFLSPTSSTVMTTSGKKKENVYLKIINIFKIILS